jgi:phosphoglucomutase
VQDILFGTSGHRGIIGESFTKHHVIAISLAIADYLKTTYPNTTPSVLLGYDTRTGNDPQLHETSYTYTILATLQHAGIKVALCDTYTPTPIISWAVRNNPYQLGIILTASHNPPNYNGIKINDAQGAPASVTITQPIQDAANALLKDITDPPPLDTTRISRVNHTDPFITHLNTLLTDTFNLDIIPWQTPYIIDCKCGSAIDVWQDITANASAPMHWLNDNHSPDFNFEQPNPTSPETIAQLSKLATEHNTIAFSNDPDADRHVVIDEQGQHISPEKLTAIIIHYCVTHNITIHSVATTLANSQLVNAICEHHTIPVTQTKIGFKYFTPMLSSAAGQQKLSIGVESSGGFSISNHTLDKCGFLPILLAIAISKKRQTPLHKLSKEIDTLCGTFEFVEDGIPFTQAQQATLDTLRTADTDHLSTVFNAPVSNVITEDGLKIVFASNDWVLCRPSGTEPLLRIYAESKDSTTAKGYIDVVKGMVGAD